MTRRSRSAQENHPDHESSPAEEARRVPLWQAIVLPLAAIIIFFLLLEGGLALFGVNPALKDQDPFVGFSSNNPLFIPRQGPDGKQYLTTAPNKLGYFNAQTFPLQKTQGSYRIFTLGGSTTYGRPYDDKTSFSGWLRALLPAADNSNNWEVINAGGISYASYRAAHLMEELVNYQPDLFIIYTGHNEFLEERTYSQIKEMPALVRTTVSLLTKTRTWSAMSSGLKAIGLHPGKNDSNRKQLGLQVDAILDESVGMNRYTRDDPLRDHILEHYRISLERMVGLARSAGADIIFVTPASSLNDCSPFKSEHTPGLSQSDRQSTEQVLAQAREKIRQENWQQAVDILEPAVSLDPRHAELQYRLGQALLGLGRFQEADAALTRARDEDVCPLRALTPMRQIVTDVAQEQGIALVDYVKLVEQHMQILKGHPIPGEELFLDHVHPTIEGHKILGLALVRSMIEQGFAQSGSGWGDQAIAEVSAIIEGQIDNEAHGRALANLSRVLLWAGKLEDAGRSARQALELAGNVRQVTVDSASILSSIYYRQGQLGLSTETLYSALESAPGGIELRLKLAENLLEPQLQQLEKAAANLLLVSQQMPSYDRGHYLFGVAMSRRGRLDIAYASLLEAIRLNPNNSGAKSALARIRPMFGNREPNPQLPQPMLALYPSTAPRKLVQLRLDASGRQVPDGIEVEFYENGRLKHFADVTQGKVNGFDITWDEHGNELSRAAFQQGVPVQLEQVQ